MFRKNKDDIIIDGNKIEYSEKGKVLRLNVTKNGIQTQVTTSTRKAIAKNQLSKLQRFRDLSERNKLKLHKSLINHHSLTPQFH